MEENTILDNLQVDEVEASYPKRMLANTIDWLFEIGCIVISYRAMPRDFIYNFFDSIPYSKYFIAFLIILGYRLLLILSIGKTIGMKILSIKYLNEDLLPLTAKEKLIAAFAMRTRNIKYHKVQ